MPNVGKKADQELMVHIFLIELAIVKLNVIFLEDACIFVPHLIINFIMLGCYQIGKGSLY